MPIALMDAGGWKSRVPIWAALAMDKAYGTYWKQTYQYMVYVNENAVQIQYYSEGGWLMSSEVTKS